MSIDDKFVLNSTIPDICKDSLFNTYKMFASNAGGKVPDFTESTKLKLMIKINDEYKNVHNQSIDKDKQKQKNNEKQLIEIQQQAEKLSLDILQQQTQIHLNQIEMLQKQGDKSTQPVPQKKSEIEKLIEKLPKQSAEQLSKIPKQFINFQNSVAKDKSSEYMITDGSEQQQKQQFSQSGAREQSFSKTTGTELALINKAHMGTVMANSITKIVKPTWHRPWKLMRVISGHKGWVRCIAIDPANQFFVTGSSDRTIKFWDLATGQLKITLTGHISTVRGLIVSHRHPYLFSVSEDKTVRCWDLEMNQVIRNYHGHLSGVYSIAQHPTLDVLVTGGRDAVARVWDIRMRSQVHVLGGHEHTVWSVQAQEFEPQIITGSQDCTIRIWDLASGKSIKVLTNHKKSVRSMLVHPQEYTFCSAAADNIKVWKCPEGNFLRNIEGHNSIINSIALNNDNVLASAADNGSLKLWDWKSGYNFQTILQKPQPGSIAAENGIFCCAFDRSSMRLLTGECDKSIKIYKEDEDATPETHPINDFKIEYDRGF